MGLLYQSRKKSHGSHLDESLRSEESDGVGAESEGVFARPGLIAIGRDGVLEDAEVAVFVVADFLDAVVGVVWETEGGEGAGVEG